jgi:phosphonate transport system substrate-binding protein
MLRVAPRRPSRAASRWLGLVLAASLGWLGTAAHALVFVVNEGVTYRVSNDEIRARYALIAADLTKILRQPVQVEPVADYPTLRKGLAGKEYDLAFVHPAHLSMLAIRDSGYRLLVVTKGFQNYTASFMVRADSPLKNLKELSESSLGVPDEDSITSWMVRATMRDNLGPAPKVRYSYTRYQDAVPFFVEHGLTKAGASAANSVVKGWTAKGGRILGTSRPVPIKHILAGSSLSAEQAQQVREYFLSLDASDEGKKRLEPIKYQGFAPYDEAEMLAIGKWLGL